MRRIGKPASLADSPWGKPSTVISSPGRTPALSKVVSSASHAIGMAAWANSGGALITMAATSCTGSRTHSGRGPSRTTSGWRDRVQFPWASWKR